MSQINDTAFYTTFPGFLQVRENWKKVGSMKLLYADPGWYLDE